MHTGWRESEAGAPIPGYEALVEERGAAAAVKREQPILVVLGNPPYNAYAGVSPEGEGGLVEPYKEGLQAVWGVKKFNLDDLYVRFFRIAERRIAEGTRRGVVSYISNCSWTALPSFYGYAAMPAAQLRPHVDREHAWRPHHHGVRARRTEQRNRVRHRWVLARHSAGCRDGVARTDRAE